MKVSAKQYANALYELTDGQSDSDVSGVVEKFVLYMKKTGDMKKSHSVMTQFENVYNEKNDVVEATVTSARELTSRQQEQVQSFIVQKYDAKSVVVNTIVDKDVKGGIIIRVGDEILDGSVNGRLKLLKNNLKY
ncbi:MAG: ATP synthase F1 subunit delta [Patescibacteria group bacterium]